MKLSKDKMLDMMSAALTIEYLLYNSPESEFISINPHSRDPYVHLTEKGFREFFGDDFEIDLEDPTQMNAYRNGTKFIALADRRLDK